MLINCKLYDSLKIVATNLMTKKRLLKFRMPKSTYLKAVILASLFSLFFLETEAQKTIHAFQLEEPINIDGVFEPAKWTAADSTSDFIQMEPQTGEVASEKTVAYFKDSTVFVRLSNNAELSQWINMHKTQLESPDSRVVFISNMTRKDPNSGL